jgi:hypothetical protein
MTSTKRPLLALPFAKNILECAGQYMIVSCIADNHTFPSQKLAGTTATGFALLDSGKIEYISQCITPESVPNAQFNDGGCDPLGRFIAGTRRIDSAIRTCGNLFVYDPHTKETKNITTSAGEFGVGRFSDLANVSALKEDC